MNIVLFTEATENELNHLQNPDEFDPVLPISMKLN